MTQNLQRTRRWRAALYLATVVTACGFVLAVAAATSMLLENVTRHGHGPTAAAPADLVGRVPG
jgi:hypothetical protein